MGGQRQTIESRGGEAAEGGEEEGGGQGRINHNTTHRGSGKMRIIKYRLNSCFFEVVIFSNRAEKVSMRSSEEKNMG